MGNLCLYLVVFALQRKITMQLMVENGQWRTISIFFVVFALHRKTTMQLMVENGQWRTISIFFVVFALHRKTTMQLIGGKWTVENHLYFLCCFCTAQEDHNAID